jgi:hypothetical protein
VVLSQFSFTEAQRRKIAAKREKDLLKDISGAVVDAEGKPVADPEAVEDEAAAEIETSDVSELASEADIEDSQDVAEPQRDVLDEQTTLTSGGDRFGGEEDFGFEEPGEVDAEIEAQLGANPDKVEAATSSFSAWRSEHTKDNSQITSETEKGILETAYEEGDEAGRNAAQNNTLEDLAESEPTVAEIQPEFADAADTTSASDKATSPEQDPLDLSSSTIADVDLPSDQPSVATQEVSPSATATEHELTTRKD